jgi:hypothetical protein
MATAIRERLKTADTIRQLVALLAGIDLMYKTA